MKLSEQEQKSLKTRMLVGGYSDNETNYFDTSSYKKLRETMLDYLPKDNEEIFDFHLLPKSNVLQSGKFVIDKHFGKADLKVLYTNGDDLESKILVIFGHNPKPEQYDEIIDYINSQVDLVKVTDIPVYLTCNGLKNGYVCTTYFYGYKVMEEDYFKKLPVCIREIGIEGGCNESTQCLYVHEMTHALVDRHKGAIRNLLNVEALSIFMEKVAALDLDQSGYLIDMENLERILQNKLCLLDREILKFRDERFMDILKDNTYIISTLGATALFDTYLKGSNKVRNEIDASIGRIISGEEVLEDVFNHYEASLEKGAKVMRKQIKKYHNEFVDEQN